MNFMNYNFKNRFLFVIKQKFTIKLVQVLLYFVCLIKFLRSIFGILKLHWLLLAADHLGIINKCKRDMVDKNHVCNKDI